MARKKNYPVVSVFVDDVQHISRELESGDEVHEADITLDISAYKTISPSTRDKCLTFAHELTKYFTPHLLLHHYQDEVPVFTVFVGVSERGIDVNLHGGYYANFIRKLPPLQNLLDEIMLLVKDDLNIQRNNVEDIVMELESGPRLDIREVPSQNTADLGEFEEDLFWNYKRVLRTPSSELYQLYLNDESAGEIHIHIGKQIDVTIITTLDITEKEKAQLMGYIHETLLETLEDEAETNSTITFYSEAEEYI